MNRWEYIGPVWNTETVYRILEIFRDEKIPFAGTDSKTDAWESFV